MYDGPSQHAPCAYKFTGKERDSESGLDNFGARYNSSALGRFMTPDWSASPEPVPYAKLPDPQSLNLYSYVRNNPSTYVDADGHCWPQWLCNLGQRVNNTFHGEGFHTNQQVDQFHRAKSYLQEHNVNVKGLGFAAVVKTYQTYTKANSQGTVYSGRTGGLGTPEQNIQLRDRTHHMNEQGYGPAELDKSSTNPDAIRGREQQLIKLNGGAQSEGGTSGNAINGVSPNNPKAGQYAGAAEEEFGTVEEQLKNNMRNPPTPMNNTEPPDGPPD
jgi:RHS repeat-associated protein